MKDRVRSCYDFLDGSIYVLLFVSVKFGVSDISQMCYNNDVREKVRLTL